MGVRSPVDGAAFAGPNVVTLQGRHVRVRDLQGHEIHDWLLSAGRGARARLEDVSNGVAAIAVGASLRLLRLSDGKEIRVRSTDSGPPLHAAFSRSELVYSYNVPSAARPGRVAVVPNAQVASTFGR